jgi:acetoin utilization deacetylase AcuC-like enzyme
VPTPVLFRHPSSLDHDPGPHPERAARIVAIEEALRARDWLGHDVRESPAATEEQLLRVHPGSHLRAIERLCAAGGGSIDPDTTVSPGSWTAALHSAGGAVAVVDALLTEDVGVAASLHRPPGHHAEPAQAMGFCLLANVAVAAHHALAVHGLERILVLDWDVHHGNGTHDIFYTDPRVLFASLHQWPLWPGTGAGSERGAGEGVGYTLNLPVPAGSGDALWCSLVEHVVAPLAREYRPQLVLVSAGYDAHRDDPLADCDVTDDGFATMAASVTALVRDLGVPLGFVLEGGYDVDALARSVVRTLEAATRRAPGAVEVAEHPQAPVLRAELSELWPGLASGV